MAASVLAVLVALVAITAGLFISTNKMLFGLDTGDAKEFADLIQSKDDVLDFYLEKHHKQIGDDDFIPYKNHCLRVMVFARYHLKQQQIEVTPRLHNIMALALAYHDIALWTDGALNYLEPSAVQMDQRVLLLEQQAADDGDEGSGYLPTNLHFSTLEEDSQLAKAIILQHHKFTDYNHPNATKVEHFDDVVNAVRKGDWADATIGMIRFGLPQSLLAAAYTAIPEAGFHMVLAGMAPKLSPDNVLAGNMEVLKIFKW